MLSLSTITGLFLFALAAWIWNCNLKSKEIALAAAKNSCIQQGVQLLDSTIHFSTCKPCRGEHGKFGILRAYHFEYYDGTTRQRGLIKIFELNVVNMSMTLSAQKKVAKKNLTHNNVIQFLSSKKETHDKD